MRGRVSQLRCADAVDELRRGHRRLSCRHWLCADSAVQCFAALRVGNRRCIGRRWLLTLTAGAKCRCDVLLMLRGTGRRCT